MDQNSKEYLPGQERPLQPEAADLIPAEAEPLPESFSAGPETGGAPPAESQPDSQSPPEYAEEEIQQQVGEIADLAEPDKLTHLKSVALKHGVAKAVKVAQKINNPWLLDKFHDMIMDDPELKKQLEATGKIEKL